MQDVKGWTDNSLSVSLKHFPWALSYSLKPSAYQRNLAKEKRKWIKVLSLFFILFVILYQTNLHSLRAHNVFENEYSWFSSQMTTPV